MKKDLLLDTGGGVKVKKFLKKNLFFVLNPDTKFWSNTFLYEMFLLEKNLFLFK